jgi:putative membrane protein
MADWLGEAYPWVKAVHLMAVIAWMAGMLYLPRLFVYHAESEAGSEKSETFKVMERRLLRGIMNPSMILVWVLGIMIFTSGAWWNAGWMHAKWLLVILLTAWHHLLAVHFKQFREDRNTRSPRYYRVINEIPALFMVGIVILVIVKPF